MWCAPVGSNSERDSGKVKGEGQGMARRGENIDTYVYTVLYAHSLCVTLLCSPTAGCIESTKALRGYDGQSYIISCRVMYCDHGIA